MPTVIMPKMGDAMEEGTVVKWLKAIGDQVAKNEPIAEIETDKATVELTADYVGTLSKRFAGEGESVAIGKPLAVITSEGESADAGDVAPAPAPAAPEAKAAGAAPEGSAPAAPSPQPEQQTAQAPAPAEGERLKVSPLARRIAQEHEIDLRQVRGSGPNGRIVREDVEAVLRTPQAASAQQDAAPAPAEAPVQGPAPQVEEGDERVPLSRMRTAIARQMSSSKSSIPHFYVSAEVDMTEALSWRKRLNAAAAAEGYKITVNDMIVKAAAMALVKYPNLNASFGGDHIVMHKHVNISIAVALEEGLIAPVVRDVDKKSLGTVARDANDLVGRARAGKVTPAEYSGGTFTVSNLGPFGVDTFIAIVTAPQGGALAVASSAQKAVVVDGEIVIRDRMNIALSADHRLTDGAEGAQFIGEVRRLLENPLALLM